MSNPVDFDPDTTSTPPPSRDIMSIFASADIDTLRILVGQLQRTLEDISYVEEKDHGTAWTRAARLRRKYSTALTTMGGVTQITAQLAEALAEGLERVAPPELCDTCGWNPHAGPCAVPYLPAKHRVLTVQGRRCINYFDKTCPDRKDVLAEHIFLSGKGSHICGGCAEQLRDAHPDMFELNETAGEVPSE